MHLKERMRRIPCTSSLRLASNTKGSFGLFLKEKTPAACHRLCLVSLAQRGVLEIHPRGCLCHFLAFISETRSSYEVRLSSLLACVREAVWRSHTENTIITLMVWLLGGSSTSISLSPPLEFCPCSHSLRDPVHRVSWTTLRASLALAHLLDNVSWVSWCPSNVSAPQPSSSSTVHLTW